MSFEKFNKRDELLEDLLSNGKEELIKNTVKKYDLKFNNYSVYEMDLYIEFLPPENDYKPRLELVTIKPLKDIGINYELVSEEFTIKFADFLFKPDINEFSELMEDLTNDFSNYREINLKPVTDEIRGIYNVDCELDQEGHSNIFFEKEYDRKGDIILSDKCKNNRLILATNELNNLFDLWEGVIKDFKQGLTHLGLEYERMPRLNDFFEK